MQTSGADCSMIQPTSSVGYGVTRTWRRTNSVGRSDSSRRRSSWRTNAANAASMWRSHDGTHTAPCSITPIRRVGNRSRTPSKIIVASVCAGGPGMPM